MLFRSPQTRDVLQGLLLNHYLSIAVGDDGRAAAMEALAQKIHANYQSKITKRETAIGLPPLEELAKQLLERMLDPEQGVPVEVQLRLRSKLNLPAAATPATNAPAR